MALTDGFELEWKSMAGTGFAVGREIEKELAGTVLWRGWGGSSRGGDVADIVTAGKSAPSDRDCSVAVYVRQPVAALPAVYWNIGPMNTVG